MDNAGCNRKLLDEVLRGKRSHNDRLFLEWLNREEVNRNLYESELSLLAQEIRVGQELDADVLWERVNGEIVVKEHRRVWRRMIRYAAIFALPMVVACYFLLEERPGEENREVLTFIQPGGKTAELELSDGTRILLDSVSLDLEELNGTRIAREKGGELVYRPAGSKTDAPLMNTIRVPVRGEYSVMLSDGTKVWLGALSTLKYPVNFFGDRRDVYLEGEAFFEVAPDKGKPFTVICDRFTVRALGTSFNIMNYKDEGAAETTLSTGKIEVMTKEMKRVLVPGQQAVVKGNELVVREVNLTPYTSWMNDRFYFSNERLEVIMRKISRWYGVEVIYKDPGIRDYHFTGNLPKYSEITKVFDLLGLITDVYFDVNGNLVTISDR